MWWGCITASARGLHRSEDFVIRGRYGDGRFALLRGIKAAGRRASPGRPPARRFGCTLRLKRFGFKLIHILQHEGSSSTLRE
jgi:hypothetical protein